MRIDPRSKRTLATVLVAGAAVAVPALAVAGGGGGGQGTVAELETRLKGQNEVPGPGDPNGKGNIDVKLKKQSNGKKKACFDLSYRQLSGASAAHIHKGGEDVAGPIKVLLFEAKPELPGEDRVKECVRISGKQLRKLKRNPAKFYVNVHNEEYPDGAIRGQLKLAGD